MRYLTGNNALTEHVKNFGVGGAQPEGSVLGKWPGVADDIGRSFPNHPSRLEEDGKAAACLVAVDDDSFPLPLVQNGCPDFLRQRVPVEIRKVGTELERVKSDGLFYRPPIDALYGIVGFDDEAILVGDGHGLVGAGQQVMEGTGVECPLGLPPRGPSRATRLRGFGRGGDFHAF